MNTAGPLTLTVDGKVRSARKKLKRSPARYELMRHIASPQERVRGTAGFDGLERISTQTLIDILVEVPQRKRRAGTYRQTLQS